METQRIEELVDLTGKAAVVIGGAMGIGQTIVFALAKSGAAVMIADGNLEAAHETVAKVTEQGGYAEAMAADACSMEDARRVVRATVERMGRIDIVVNTAATFSFSRELPTVPSLWNRVLGSHVKGVYYYCDAAAREMAQAGRGGRIVNIASLEAMQPPAQPVSNSVTESSVAIISKALAVEYGAYGVNVNALAPSLVETPAVRVRAGSLTKPASGTLDEFVDRSQPRLVIDQIRAADELVTVVLFLVSDAAADVTGNLVTVG